MKPAPMFRRPLAFAAAVPALTLPVKPRADHALPGPIKGAFQLRTEGMFDYLVDTLRKSW
jgi:hypothetical protein